MSSSPFHHYTFYPGTKKITPLKIRNPSIHPSQIMPSPSGVPFNIQEMPWCYSGKPGQLMEFNAVIRPSPIFQNQYQQQLCPYPLLPEQNLTFSELRKRKTEPDDLEIPTKQFFTEEAMASHLNSLHLSTEYTTHNIETSAGDEIPTTASGGMSPSSSLDDEMSLGDMASASHHVYMSPQELEERLKKAQRISLCEEVRKLDNRTDILPKVLLERIEKPCTALVLWQPPQALEKLINTVKEAAKEKKADEKRETPGSSSDMMMADDEPLPDLPDYDDDLDFEENNNNVASVDDLNRMDVEM